jgi:hypothetical protein
MTIAVTTATAPAYWASYLVNGDASGLEDREQASADRWIAKQAPWYVVDVARDGDNEQEARFTWSYQLYGGDAKGGDVLDYVMHRQKRSYHRRRKAK